MTEPDPGTLPGDRHGAAYFAAPIRTPDWRVWLGMVISFAWILLGLAYVAGTRGFTDFFSQPADVLGSFFEGAFAPLAFLWLVIGYFLQQRELSQNTRALHLQFQEVRRQAEQATIQARAIAANELHARQDTFLRVAQQVDYQLGTISGFLFLSSQGAAGNGSVPPEEISELFRQLTRGDPQVFSLRLLNLSVNLDPEEAHALYYGTPTRARHSNHFILTFERLIQRATECDPEGMISDALRTNTHGLVHAWMIRERAKAPPELADAARTGTHLDVTGGTAVPPTASEPS